MGFLSDLAVIAVKSTIGYMQSIPEVKEAAAVLHSAEEQDGWISSEEFLDAYDVRIHDPQNDQHDIKIMKEHDFEGGYVLWNKSKNLYHTGVGTCVYKKVERHFRGYGNEAVFFDSEDGDTFAVSLYRLSDTEYDDLPSLEKALREAHGVYPVYEFVEEEPETPTPSSDVGFFGLLRNIFS